MPWEKTASVDAVGNLSLDGMRTLVQDAPLFVRYRL